MKSLESLETYRDMINNYIKDIFVPSIPEGELREMASYALTGGKRLRSSIVLDITTTLMGNSLLDVALSVELLHNASLVIDDLPTMDDDNFRRGIYTIHKIFGVEKAKMLAYFFVSEANRIVLVRDDCSKEIIIKNLEFLRRACLGQFYDMEWAKIEQIEFKENYGTNLSPMVNLKTSPFFSLSFVLAYIFSIPSYNDDDIKSLNSLAENFSLAFQIMDDFDDVEKDREKRSLNHVIVYGKERSVDIFNRSILGFNNGIKELKLESPFFKDLIAYMENRLK
jgi:geranylgeranyl diphosphate synthase type II